MWKKSGIKVSEEMVGHKRNIDNYVGYWSFEAGAICKIMGLNPEDFKGVNYFPYDLVAECGK